MEKILIAAPIRQRQQVIDEYLDCIYKLDYPKNLICIYFLVNDSTDNTWEKVCEFRSKYLVEYSNIELEYINLGSSKDDRTGIRKKEIYSVLSVLRNKILSYFLTTDCTHLFSIDSDIMVKPDALKVLLSDDKDIISTWISNEFGGKRGNALDFIDQTQKNGDTDGKNIIMSDKNGKPVKALKHIDVSVPTCPDIFMCDITGAVYLIKKSVIESGVRYGYYQAGEDVTFCENAKARGYKLFCRKGLAEHRMYHMHVKKGSY